MLAFDGCLGFGLVVLGGCGLVGVFLFVLSGFCIWWFGCCYGVVGVWLEDAFVLVLLVVLV